MANVLIGLGTNLGNRQANLKAALEALGKLAKTRILQVSQFYETAPLGGPPQGDYLNAVAQLETPLKPEALLASLKSIERELGRPETHPRWGPRIIDLDLLSYDAEILETERLTLPHPRMHERPFVLIPLAEIAPHWRHPVLGLLVQELISALEHAGHSKDPSA